MRTQPTRTSMLLMLMMMRTQPSRTSMLLMLMMVLFGEELWIENTTYKDKHVVVIIVQGGAMD